MDEVRIGVIGCGGMANNHMSKFADISRLKFTAATDVVQENIDRTVDKFGVKGFERAEDMLGSGLIDAVLIATPHYFHPQYAVQAFEAGLHVLTEKPVAVTARGAAEMNAAADKHPELVFAAMHQMRTSRAWRKIKQLAESGELGEIQRIHWVITTWFRSQAYYNRGGWRGTWKGEGGGVLVNQCPHNLDLLCWIMGGTPSQVRAFLSIGKYHDIEVEDDVTAFMQYENGATGVFVTSTGEAPGTNFFELVGDRGKVALGVGGGIEFVQTDSSTNEFIKTSSAPFGRPEMTEHMIKLEGGGGHAMIHQNFVDAILDGTPVIAPGREGLNQVELANAMILSGVKHKAVDIPTDHAEYEKALEELIEQAEAAKRP